MTVNALTNGQAHDDAPDRSSPLVDRSSPLVPPHIAWPLFVVLLLAMSVSAALFTAYMANSDGGVELVDGAPHAPSSEPEGDR